MTELRKIKNIICAVVCLLEKHIDDLKNHENIPIAEERGALLNFLIGNRENAVSIIIKLANLLVKLDALGDGGGEEKKIDKMEEIDFELIEKFLREKREGRGP
ncbi:MAG: hypothetical protein LBB09_01715 [Rickettsiales bacterium]|nr:hypothetical protein [Rickettsiales bacterium]